MQNVMDNPRFTYDLVKRGVFKNSPIRLADVGMRAGAESVWNAFGPHLRVVGFEPDADECARINASETVYEKQCFPIALDKVARKRNFIRREHNLASSGFTRHDFWWTYRFGTPAEGSHPFEVRLPERDNWKNRTEDTNATLDMDGAEIETATLTGFLESIDEPVPDFLKVDVEGAELDVLKGAESLLCPGGILAVKSEVRFLPDREGALFHDIYAYLFAKGYFLMNFEVNRNSRRALPMPVAWNHKDQHGNLIGGPTRVGQPIEGDIVMFRDLIADDFVPESEADVLRVIKTAAMFEIYNLPDCAAELLIYYKSKVDEIIDVQMIMDQLVPFGFDPPAPSFTEYVEEQKRTIQRFRPPGEEFEE